MGLIVTLMFPALLSAPAAGTETATRFDCHMIVVVPDGREQAERPLSERTLRTQYAPIQTKRPHFE